MVRILPGVGQKADSWLLPSQTAYHWLQQLLHHVRDHPAKQDMSQAWFDLYGR